MNAPWRLATAALQAAAQAKLQAAKASLLLAPLSFAVSAFLALLQAVPKTPGAPAAAKAIRARFFLKFFVGNSVEASKASAPKSAPAPKPQATHRGASRSIAERMRCVLGFGRSFFGRLRRSSARRPRVPQGWWCRRSPAPRVRAPLRTPQRRASPQRPGGQSAESFLRHPRLCLFPPFLRRRRRPRRRRSRRAPQLKGRSRRGRGGGGEEARPEFFLVWAARALVTGRSGLLPKLRGFPNPGDNDRASSEKPTVAFTGLAVAFLIFPGSQEVTSPPPRQKSRSQCLLVPRICQLCFLLQSDQQKR